MIISLDHDGTYSLDPEFWNAVVELAKAKGHMIYCITGRDDTPENRLAVKIPGVEVVFCNHVTKRQVASAKGINVQVWIDDWPEAVGPCAGKS